MYLLREHFEKLIPLTEEEFAFIASHFTQKVFKKHQFLVQEDYPVHNDFWVESGLLKVYRALPNGKEHIVQFAMEDWWTSDYQALFNNTPATLNITCLEDTTVWVINNENWEKLCNEMHKVEHFFRLKANRGYVALQKRVLSLLSDDAKTRYEQFVECYPSLLQRIPKSLIAAYLGVSRETLSRLYKE